MPSCTSGSAAARETRPSREILERLATASGGRAFMTERIERLERAFSQILDELGHQDLVAYSPTNTRRDGTWRKIAVTVDGEHSVGARQGYRARGRPLPMRRGACALTAWVPLCIPLPAAAQHPPPVFSTNEQGTARAPGGTAGARKDAVQALLDGTGAVGDVPLAAAVFAMAPPDSGLCRVLVAVEVGRRQILPTPWPSVSKNLRRERKRRVQRRRGDQRGAGAAGFGLATPVCRRECPGARPLPDSRRRDRQRGPSSGARPSIRRRRTASRRRAQRRQRHDRTG